MKAMLLALIGALSLAGQEIDVDRQLERAGRLFEMGQRSGEAGNRLAEIAAYRDALELVDDARAATAGPRADIEFGRREMQLTLADAYLAADRPREALELLQGMTAEQASAAEAGAERGARLHLARTLRAQVGAAFRAGAHAEGREALVRLVELGRSMQADEPANAYLMRTLARDLESETFVRFMTGDGDGARAAAAEAARLFGALASANPDSVEARRSHLTWAAIAAELTGDAALDAEAVAAGEWLEVRGELRPTDRDRLEAARARLAQTG